MDEDTAAGGPKQCGIEIEGAKESLPRGAGGIAVGAEQIEGKFRLGQEQVPTISREVGIRASQQGQEVVFEGLDGSFGSVPAMNVWGDKLHGAVISLDSFF